MSYADAYVMLGAMFAIGLIIRWTQNRPVEGPFGMMDLIVPQEDPRDRLIGIFASIILPLLVGAVVGLVLPGRAYIAALGVGLGALMSISTAFFRPDIMVPPIRNQLHLAQVIYGFFVISYAGLGALGALVSSYFMAVVSNNASFVSNIGANLISWGIITLFSYIVRVNRLGKLSRAISTVSAYGYPVSAELGIQSARNDEREEAIRTRIHDIIREEIEAVKHETASTVNPLDE